MNKKVTITFSENYQKKFGSISQVKKWIDNEITFWTTFSDSISSQRDDTPKEILSGAQQQISNEQIHPLKKIEDALTLLSDIEFLEATFNRFNPYKLLVSEMPSIKRAFSLTEKHPIASIFLLSMIARNQNNSAINKVNYYINRDSTNHIIRSNLEKNKAIAYYEYAKIFYKKDSTDRLQFNKWKDNAEECSANLEIELNNLQKQIDFINKEHQSNIDKYEQLIEEKNKLIDNHVTEHKQDLDKQIKFYKTELSLQAPVTYWENKQKNHSTSASWWGAAFFASMIGIFLLITLLVEPFIAHLVSIDGIKDNNLITGLLITLPIFLCIWVLKIISKNIVVNLNQMHESANRKVMTETFLALVAEDEVDKKERAIVLNAIFSPVSTTGSTDDGSPPHWLQYVEKIK